MNKETIKDLLYDIRNEFCNELQEDYISEVKRYLDEYDYELMIEFLDRYVNKVYIIIDEYKESEEDK